MKKTIFYILILTAVLIWREYTNANRIAEAIQATSDDLLIACEAKIDELNAEKAKEYARGFNSCLAQF